MLSRWRQLQRGSGGPDPVEQIRRLAHGIYPPSLVSGGLARALPAVAAHVPIPIHLDLQGLGRYPAPIEAALYFCCIEALQNATKHGGTGTSVTIRTRYPRRRHRRDCFAGPRMKNCADE